MRRFLTHTFTFIMVLVLCMPAAIMSAHTANSIEAQQSIGTTSLQSVNFPDRYMVAAADGSGVEILPVSDESDDALKELASFALVPGLADESLASLQVNSTMFVVATSDGVILQSLDNIADLSTATFNIVDGLAGSGISFESAAQPDHYLRHSGFVLRLNQNDGSQLFMEDASFIEVAPFGSGGEDLVGDSEMVGDAPVRDCTQEDFQAAVTAGETNGTITLDGTCRYLLTSAGDTWNGGSGAMLRKTTVIEGNGAIIERSANAPSFRIFALQVDAPEGTVIRDVTIRNGSPTGPGGGLWLNSDVTMENVTLEGNAAKDMGGAILSQKNLLLNNVTIKDNTGSRGGAIAMLSGDLTIDDSQVTNNRATDLGGAIYAQGNLVLRNVTIEEGNGKKGGAIAQMSGALTLDNGQLINNHATDNGGAIYKQAGALDVTDTVFAQNSADSKNGAAIFINGSDPGAKVTNCTITDNDDNLGIAIMTWSSLTLRNTIIANHDTALAAAGGASQVVSEDYNLFANIGRVTQIYNPGTTIAQGTNSLQAPAAQFVDAAAFNYALKASSPAVDKGTDAILNLAESSAIDVAGMARPFNGTLVDIGAYEYQGEGTASLSIIKKGPLWIAAGTQADYSLTITNDGARSGEALDVVDVLPDGAEYVVDSATEDGTFADGRLTWQIGTLAPGEQTFIQYTVVSSQTLVSKDYSVKSTTDPEVIASGKVITSPLNARIIASLNFLPQPDGFSFQNYGDSPKNDSDLTVEEMVYIFGEDAVCKSTNPCILRASAEAWRTKWLTFVKGGHCAGMAMGSLNIFANATAPDSAFQIAPGTFLDLREASNFQSEANVTYDLAIEDARKYVALYATTQTLSPLNWRTFDYKRDPVQKLVPYGRGQAWRTNPVDVLDTLIANLKDPNATDRYRLSFRKRNGQGGHTVVPFAVEKLNANDHLIYIYENNRPNRFDLAIQINRSTGAWSYVGTTNPKLPLNEYSGDANTNTLTLTSWQWSHTFPKECDFCPPAPVTDPGSSGTVQVQLNGEGYHLVTRSDGKQAGFDLNTGEWISEIEGAEAVEIVTGLGLNTPPAIQIPHEEGMSYDIDIASSKTAYGNTEAPADLNIFGPGFAMGLSNLVLNSPVPQADSIATAANQPDLMSLNIDPAANRLTFEPGIDDAETPSLSLAVSQADGSDFSVDVKNVRVENGHAVALAFDENSQSVTIEDNSAGETSYQVELNRINTDGTQDTFVSDNVSDDGQAGITLAVGDEWDGESAPEIQVEETGTLPEPRSTATTDGTSAQIATCDLATIPDPTSGGVMVRFINETDGNRYLATGTTEELYTMKDGNAVSNLITFLPGESQDYEASPDEEWNIYGSERPWESDDPFSDIKAYYIVGSESKQCFAFVDGSYSLGDRDDSGGDTGGDTTAAEEAVTSPTTCVDAVQGKIAWDYEGTTSWDAENLERLCQGAESSIEPASCFEQVMHGGIDWGGGTQWGWSNALDLCESTLDADGTIQCFESAISSGDDWEQAIADCGQ